MALFRFYNKVVFDIMVMIAFQSALYLEMHGNNIYFFIYFQYQHKEINFFFHFFDKHVAIRVAKRIQLRAKPDYICV